MNLRQRIGAEAPSQGGESNGMGKLFEGDVGLIELVGDGPVSAPRSRRGFRSVEVEADKLGEILLSGHGFFVLRLEEVRLRRAEALFLACSLDSLSR